MSQVCLEWKETYQDNTIGFCQKLNHVPACRARGLGGDLSNFLYEAADIPNLETEKCSHYVVVLCLSNLLHVGMYSVMENTIRRIGPDMKSVLLIHPKKGRQAYARRSLCCNQS